MSSQYHILVDNVWGSREISKAASGVVAVLTLCIASAYIAGLSFLFRYARRPQKHSKRRRVVRLRQYAPIVHIFLGASSLLVVAIAAWLLLQFHYTTIYPNVGSRAGIRLSLFAACWTFITSTAFVVVLVHPAMRRHPLAEAGPQLTWAVLTWCYWVASLATLNRALPLLPVKTTCAGSIYCGQLRAIFAFAMMDMVTLCMSMVTLVIIVVQAWRRKRQLLQASRY
ncbi:hypothetical protein OBBRIDRAFT_794002 [Obba rivulosa]|uniref:Uncharacterized protein n=1 Tax=Obba rivulosa TaxID=1052685 RepID=A0A8E2ARK2_9APHY|nr:hypothetical protein OBBRIDRAFT_794002 [Obba rivulosa]